MKISACAGGSEVKASQSGGQRNRRTEKKGRWQANESGQTMKMRRKSFDYTGWRANAQQHHIASSINK